MSFGFYKKTTLLMFILSVFVVSSCMKEKSEPPKSLEQIRAEEGIPVEVRIISKSEFTKSLSYFSILEGFKQTTKPSPMHDKIIKINAKVGDFVEEGKVVLEFPSDNPTMQLEQAKAALDIAKKTYDRMKELLATGDISQSQFDGAETQYIVAKRNFESMNQIVKVQTPISGTIIALPVRVGDYPKFDEPLFTVAQLHKMIAKIKVSDSEVGQIQKGMPAVAIWNGKEYPAIVSDVSLAMDLMSRSFMVEVEINNPQKAIKSGVTAEILIRTFSNTDAISITRDVVTQEGERFFVYVDNNGTAQKKEIQVGNTSGVDIEVVEGLNVGDRLINCCISLLQDGAKIKVVN